MATEILPNLWLGSLDDALNKDFIIKNQINCIFNCTINKPFINNPQIIHKYRVPIKDDNSNEEKYLLFCLLDDIIETIKLHYIARDNILIHCFAGKQRSVGCIIGFLIKYGNIKLDKAIELVQNKRPIAATPGFNFYKTLVYYQSKIDSN